MKNRLLRQMLAHRLGARSWRSIEGGREEAATDLCLTLRPQIVLLWKDGRKDEDGVVYPLKVLFNHQ